MSALELLGFAVLSVAGIVGVLRAFIWTVDAILDGKRNYEWWVEYVERYER